MLTYSVENDYTTQVLGLVWIEAFLYAGVKREQLWQHQKWSGQREFRNIRLQLEKKISGATHRVRNAIADRYDNSAELFHLHEHFAFRLHARLAEEECDASLGRDN